MFFAIYDIYQIILPNAGEHLDIRASEGQLQTRLDPNYISGLLIFCMTIKLRVGS